METLIEEFCLNTDNYNCHIKQNVTTLQNMNINITNPITVQSDITIANNRLTVTNDFKVGIINELINGKKEAIILDCIENNNIFRKVNFLINNSGDNPLTLSIQIGSLEIIDWYDIPNCTDIVIPSDTKKLLKINELTRHVKIKYDSGSLTTNLFVQAIGII